ncbi:MAG: ImmA/IrrE family metallo-endopeptidase [Candidatus Hodarchaeota archaeon]
MKQDANGPWILLGELYSDKHLNGESREDLVRETKEKLYAYVWTRMRRYGEVRPPFIENPEKSHFVKAQGVQRIVSSDIEGYGYLLRENDHFIIVTKKGLGEIKKRTVIAHELGHTFFLNSNSKSSNFYYGWGSSKNYWKFIEGPAFEIGRQILVPKQSLPLSVNQNVTIKSFIELRRKYKTSKNIMALRLIHDLRLWDVYLFFTRYDSSSGKITLPKNHERFKGMSFKNFNLNKKWNLLAEILKKSIIVPGKSNSEEKKIGRNYYNIQSYSKTGTEIMCLIKSK